MLSAVMLCNLSKVVLAGRRLQLAMENKGWMNARLQIGEARRPSLAMVRGLFNRGWKGQIVSTYSRAAGARYRGQVLHGYVSNLTLPA